MEDAPHAHPNQYVVEGLDGSTIVIVVGYKYVIHVQYSFWHAV